VPVPPSPPYKTSGGCLPALVRCFSCHHVVDRSGCREVGGLLYGACCAEKARNSCAFWCELCGCSFLEEDMATMTTCKLCEAAL
jgi:hypothetical protein